MLQHIRPFTIVLYGVCLYVSCSRASCDGYEIRRSVEYKQFEGDERLLADVYLPDKTEKPWPTLLMIHGGAWFSGNKVHVSYHAQHAVDKGFAVVAINYRLAPRYKFPAQVDDCQDALAWIGVHAKEYGFDRDRVAVYGYSAGAQLACLIGMTQNVPHSREGPGASRSRIPPRSLPKIRAVVAGGTPCEFSWIPEDAQTLAYWLGDSRATVPKVYAAASPLAFVDEGDPPIFLFHGAADRIVPLESPQKMADQLKVAQVPYKLHIIEDATHVGAFLDQGARKAAILFLKRHLELEHDGNK